MVNTSMEVVGEVVLSFGQHITWTFLDVEERRNGESQPPNGSHLDLQQRTRRQQRSSSKRILLSRGRGQ